MYIKDLLSIRPVTLSYEIFPPKGQASCDSVLATAERLKADVPDFISVTYGAGGSTAKNTVGICDYIQNNLGLTALAHLTCVSATRPYIDEVIQTLEQNNIKNVLALRGDLPEGMVSPEEFKFAQELIAYIKERSSLCIGAACYPEGHVESPSKDYELDFLKEKVDQGCDFLITQMFFDNDVLYRFLYQASCKGITVPVIAGVMPVTHVKQIKRICSLSGTALTPKFKAIVDRFGDNPKALMQAGIAYATEQIVDLAANGVRGIHIYTMNHSNVAHQITENLSHILKGDEA
ncbi:methylenetetrahydrofolate reductase [NAD(P)H] [Gehongia tenuis]|uniref:Methylenetetrahydrofolate reductase n=1 Tax=Gehongia tenuis TaxID=2763655 RepID=A0A926HPA1_9FIRM|nr:methylenetetrahydrofolate reductase [NAD(P)H] [Gehongia tenuis]MBC8531454.1 methylenetetrahydrofolate reductase [NAD(P)H] [Gehongia tenuis]